MIQQERDFCDLLTSKQLDFPSPLAKGSRLLNGKLNTSVLRVCCGIAMVFRVVSKMLCQVVAFKMAMVYVQILSLTETKQPMEFKVTKYVTLKTETT